MESMRTGGQIRLATLWVIERADGVVFRFTDHDRPLYYEGEWYLTTDGVDASAAEAQKGLEAGGQEVVGPISSAAITEADLKAGKFREARVTQYKLDWRYPWLGTWGARRYWIQEISYTGRAWKAEFAGPLRFLRPSMGSVLTRNCQHRLGQGYCGNGVDLEDPQYWEEAEVTEVVFDRWEFKTTLTSMEDDRYEHGDFLWQTGGNANLQFEVHAYSTGAGKNIKLTLPTPSPIQVGDTFKVYAGCNRTAEACVNKFNNIGNFKGAPLVPGTDRVLRVNDRTSPHVVVEDDPNDDPGWLYGSDE